MAIATASKAPTVAAQREVPRAQALTTSYVLPVLVISLSFGAYFVLRYLGLWTEQDTAVFVRSILGMQEAGRLNYPDAYTHGYAYPVWATTLSNFTGIGVADLLQLYTPLIGNLFLGLFGFVTFRRLLASDRLGMLAASVLFLVPELVFTVSRGNHEKLTVSLTLLALLALVNSFLERFKEGRWLVFTGWVAVFYLTGFTLVTLSIFFGSSFIVASTLTLVFSFVLLHIRSSGAAKIKPLVQRLTLTVGTSWLLVVLVMWFVYPASGSSLYLLNTTAERLSALFLAYTPASEPSAVTFTVSDPYAVAGTDWTSLNAYRLVSSFRWVLFLTSLVTWLVLVVRAFIKLNEVPLNRLFLLALYGAFGLQLALSIPVDFLNLSAGSNLQVRMYTYFSLLAPPVFALGLVWLVERVSKGFLRNLLRISVGLLLAAFILMSLSKATLDPIISNRWLFYQSAEVRAMHFWDARHQYSWLWVDPEGRLRFAYNTTFPKRSLNDNTFNIGRPRSRHSHALYSSIIRENVVAWQQSSSVYWLENQPYDNGEVQIFHRIPRTQFQR